MKKIIEFQYNDTIDLTFLLREAIRRHDSQALLGLSLGIHAMREVQGTQGLLALHRARNLANRCRAALNGSTPRLNEALECLEQITHSCQKAIDSQHITAEEMTVYADYYKEHGVIPHCPLCKAPAEIVDMGKEVSDFGTTITLMIECRTCPHHLSSLINVPYPLNSKS